jgi:hypothetical protein
MPISGSYGSDSGKRGQGLSGGSTGVSSADGGLDTNADIVFEVPTTTYYTRAIAEGNLTVYERENLGKPIPPEADVTGAIGISADGLVAWTYTDSLTNQSRIDAAGPNETYRAPQRDTRRDFSKGHGAAAPTQLMPEMCKVGDGDLQVATPLKNPDQGASSARVKDVQP